MTPQAPTPSEHQATGASSRTLLLLLAAAALSLAFWLYARPDVVIMLSEQLWSCF
jgi:hypothetical protein